MRKSRRIRNPSPVKYFPSHTAFERLIDYSARGKSNPVLQTANTEYDHVAELLYLVRQDSVGYLASEPESDASIVLRIVNGFHLKAKWDSDVQAAEMLYAIATDTAYHVLDLYLRNRKLFDQIAPRKKVLPCLLSIHPKTAGVIRKMRRDARLGEQTDDARRVGSKTWFVSDTPANVYARAILNTIKRNLNLPPVAEQQTCWGDFDAEGKIRYIVLPFPKYVDGLEKLPMPLAPDNVLQYWRKGKEIILEEMPDFHLRPEWQKYREARNYREGAKKGAIQHAIFKDILTALKTIAGANKKPACK
jgi:hypothetical protein